jgi:hypothetical protein
MSRNSKARNSKHCHLCGRRLWGRAWVYTPNGVSDDQAVAVCRQCQETAPRCDVCGVPMGANHVRLPDGRRTCARCHQTAIYDQVRAQPLFERVARVVTDQLGLGLNVGTDFTLVDHQHLQRLATEAHPTLHDDPDKVIGLFVRKGRKRVMYVLSGLPQILLIQTMAHEWAHAWQGENCPLLQDSLVREGFAEWAAYKTLQAMGAVKKMTLMEQQDGLYGEGLRKILELERRDGMSGVLAFCRRVE